MSLVNVFFYNLKTETIVMVQKLDLPGMPFALPGGRSEPGEEIFNTAFREVAEEVGLEAAEGLIENWQGDEIEIDRGQYKQHILLVPYDGPLRKEGLLEKTENGKRVERLGPPQWISFEDIQNGTVMTDGGKREICHSHLNANHEAFSMLSDENPLNVRLFQMEEATKKFAFS